MHNSASSFMPSGRPMTSLGLTSRRGANVARSYVDSSTSAAAGPSSSPFADLNVLPRSSSVMLNAPPPSATRSYGTRPSSIAKDGTFNVHPCFRKDADWRGDVLVKVQGVQFWCHKAILYFASPFFQAVIDGDWVESHPSLHRVPSTSSAHSQLSANDGHELGDGELKQDTPRLGEVTPNERDRTRQAPPSVQGTSPRPDREEEHDDGVEAEGSHGLSSERPPWDKARHRDSFHTAIIDLEDAPNIGNRMRWSQTSASTPPPAAPSLSPASAEGEAGPSSETQARRQRSASEGGHPEQLYKAKAAATLSAVSKTLSGAPVAISAPGTPSLVQPSGADLTTRLETLATPPGSPALRLASLPSSTPDSSFTGVVRKSASQNQQSRSDRKGHSAGSRSRQQQREKAGVVAIIELPEDEAAIFQDVLFHIYPQLDLLVNWTNIAGLLRFDEQYEIHGLRRSCTTFLRAALAGRPVEAMSLAEAHARGSTDLPGSGLGLEDIYKEASRHVLDVWSSLESEELNALSSETLLKLERKRTWFLERLLKLGLANPERDYECHAACPDPSLCAKNLSDRFRSAFSACFRYGPPQPSVIWRLRELEGVANLPSMTLSCDASARVWTQNLFDRMFSLPLTSRAQAKFLYVKLNETGASGYPYRNTTTAGASVPLLQQGVGASGTTAAAVATSSSGGQGQASSGAGGASGLASATVSLLPRLARS